MASKTKSLLWNFYEKSNVGGICKLCKCSVKTSGNTTNLKNHLKRKHPSIHFDAPMPKGRRNSLPSTMPTTGSDNEDDPIPLPETHYAHLAN